MIGNDLETSEVLLSVLFCIIENERFIKCKDIHYIERLQYIRML